MAKPGTSAFTNRKQLHNLLEGIQKSQKADAYAFTGGHLNENKLYKPPPSRYEGNVQWQAASSRNKVSLSPRYADEGSEAGADHYTVHEMEETLRNFSFGTAGTLQVPSPPPFPRSQGTKGPVLAPRPTPVISQRSYSQFDDGVLVEEMAPMGQMETMVDNYEERYGHSPLKWTTDEMIFRNISSPMYVSQTAIKDTNLDKILKQKFISSHLVEITKRDQFKKMKQFEEDIIHKEDLLEQNVLSSNKVVDHLEAKLQKELDGLQYNSYGPNFHRLQIYSDVFEDLIEDSPTFKYILSIIKKEYDDYISFLLDQQPSRHKLLQDQVEQLTAHGTSDLRTLQEEQHKLAMLENEARLLLDENSRLKKEAADGKQVSEEEDHPEELDSSPIYREEVVDLADKVEGTRAQILDKLDQLNELRLTLRQNFVPSSVVSHLEQCIKETEVDMQRYLSQKEFYERSIEELERQLRNAIKDADTTDRDAKRIWNRINTVKDAVKELTNEDKDKWDWYIS